MRKRNFIREACVDTLENAVRAEAEGADRIELCSHLEQDGLTPSLGLLASVLERLTIPVHVMIRPRAGNFNYTAEEVRVMKNEIRLCRKLGAAGVVLGVLTAGNRVDVETTTALASEAAPLNVVFHKAIDVTPDPGISASQIFTIPGITGILTSGGRETAEEGIPDLKRMLAFADGSIEIIVAGKVTRQNIDNLHAKLNARAYHGRRIVFD